MIKGESFMGKLDDLERLHKLKESGAITTDEFEQEKKKILSSNEEVIEDTNQIKEDVKSIDKKGIVTDQVKIVEDITTNRICNKCGNELLEDEKFCGKCGNDVNAKKKYIKIKFNHLLTALVTVAIIIITVIVLWGDTLLFKYKISEEKLSEMLRDSDNGIYLQEETLQVGEYIDIDYKEYNKLVSYSCIYNNSNISVEAGGLILINDKNDTFYRITLDNNLTSIIYYLNTNNQKDKLQSVIELIGRYIENNGIENLVIGNETEKYMRLGRDIGEIIGLRNGRDITREALMKLTNNTNPGILLYKENEVFARYVGYNTVKQVYNWDIDETTAKYLYTYNRKTYNNLVSIYGQPYKTVNQFSVYDFANDENSLVGNYNSLDEAKEKLEVEE